MRPLQSLSIGNKKEHWDFGRSSGRVWRQAWGLLYPASGASRRSCLPVGSTSVFWQVHHGAGDPAAARRFARLSSLVVDWLSSSVRHGNSQSRRPGPLRFFGRSPPVAPRPFCDVSGAPLPAISIDVWGPCISREQRQGPAGDCSPHRFTPTLAIQLQSRQ